MNRLPAVLFGVAVLCLALPVRAQNGITADDKIFADAAMAAGLAELGAAKIALDKSQNDNVRKFAQRMVQDHGAANDELATIAKSEGLGLPTLPTNAQQARAARLRSLAGADFDQAYLDDQVAAHKEAVALFLQESKTGQDSGLRHFAERALPILNDHYQMAQSLAGKR
jgi:putative membrane protein